MVVRPGGTTTSGGTWSRLSRRTVRREFDVELSRLAGGVSPCGWPTRLVVVVVVDDDGVVVVMVTVAATGDGSGFIGSDVDVGDGWRTGGRSRSGGPADLASSGRDDERVG